MNLPTNIFKNFWTANIPAFILMVLSEYLYLREHPGAGTGKFFLYLFLVVAAWQLGGYIIETFFDRQTYFYSLVWGLLVWNFPDVFFSGKLMAAYLLMQGVWIKMYQISKNKRGLNYFDAGWLLGVTGIIYPESTLYLLWIYAGYIVVNKVIDRKLFYPVLGFAAAVLLLFAYEILWGSLREFVQFWEWQITGYRYDKGVLAFIFWGFLLVTGSFVQYVRSNRSSERQKNSIGLLLLQTLAGIGLFLINSGVPGVLLFLFTPVAYTAGELLFLIPKKLWRNIAVSCFIIMALLLRFYTNM